MTDGDPVQTQVQAWMKQIGPVRREVVGAKSEQDGGHFSMSFGRLVKFIEAEKVEALLQQIAAQQARLAPFARYGAFENHSEATQMVYHRDKPFNEDGHDADEWEDCSHPDCKFVREMFPGGSR